MGGNIRKGRLFGVLLDTRLDDLFQADAPLKLAKSANIMLDTQERYAQAFLWLELQRPQTEPPWQFFSADSSCSFRSNPVVPCGLSLNSLLSNQSEACALAGQPIRGLATWPIPSFFEAWHHLFLGDLGGETKGNHNFNLWVCGVAYMLRLHGPGRC